MLDNDDLKIFNHICKVSYASGPQAFWPRDQFHGRQFFCGPRERGHGFEMIQAHYIYCVLYFYYYYISRILFYKYIYVIQLSKYIFILCKYIYIFVVVQLLSHVQFFAAP